MMDQKIIERDLALFSDPATPFKIETSGKTARVRLIRYGEERDYLIDLKTGKIDSRHKKQTHASLSALLASSEFADLRGFAATQGRIYSSKTFSSMLEPAGVVDPDGKKFPLNLDIGRELFAPILNQSFLKILLIDGPAGIGKTSFIERMVFERTNQPSLPPILHITSKGRRLSNISDAMGKTASDLHADFRADQVPTLARLNVLQVAIDGFDELVHPDGYGNAWAALEDIVRQIGSGGPLILAGRDTFFDQQSVRTRFDRFGTKVQMEMVRLHEVGEVAARKWLVQKGWSEKELGKVTLRSFFRRPYTRRPFFLSQIARFRSFEDIPAQRGSPQLILIDELLQREAKILGSGLLTISEAVIRDKLGLLLEEMAGDMAEREAETISREFLEFYCEYIFADVVEREQLSAIRHKVGSVALIETKEDGRGDLHFPHSEIQNHFLARALFRALASKRPFSALRSTVLGIDVIEAYADVCRTADSAISVAAVVELQRLLESEKLAIRLSSNAVALLIASLVRGENFGPPLRLEGLQTNEVRIFDKLAEAHLRNVSISRMDARGADLSNIVFDGCSIGVLIADDVTRFGMSIPVVATLQIDDLGNVRSEHSPERVQAWIVGHSASSKLLPSESEDYRNLPMVKFFDRVCYRFIRQHYIRDSEQDEGQLLLRDRYWSEVFRILYDARRIRVEKRSAAGPSGQFYHLIEPQKLLSPNGDEEAAKIRTSIVARAIALAH